MAIYKTTGCLFFSALYILLFPSLWRMRKNRLHTVSVIVGSVLALAIAFSQFLTPEFISSPEKVKTEKSDQKSTDDSSAFISLPSFSLPAPVHVESNLEPYCLFEIILEEDIDENHIEDEVSLSNRFFRAMFEVIICPNAP